MGYKYAKEDIKKKVNVALGVLLKNDYFLLENRAHERSVSHKLAEYLQQEFPDWNVDCEYNLKGVETKELDGIRDCSEQKRTNRVFPDIIVHQRNSDSNLLVIELKTINQDFKCDIKKLELFTRKDKGYKYQLGLHIEFDNCRPKLRWFKNGKEEKSSKLSS